MAWSKAWPRRGWASSVFLFFWLERLTLNSEVLLSFLMTLKDLLDGNQVALRTLRWPHPALQALINGLLLLLILRL